MVNLLYLHQLGGQFRLMTRALIRSLTFYVRIQIDAQSVFLATIHGAQL